MRYQSSPPKRDRHLRKYQNIYPLPSDTCKLAMPHAEQCANYGLRLERFLLWTNKEQSWELTKQTKERFTKQVNGRKALDFTQPEAESLLKSYRERWEAMLDAYQQRGYEVKRFPLQAASRVIVDLGAESVMETSIRLHRVYGFPIIPGSALKGLARSYALSQIAEQLGIPALSLEHISAREQAGQQTPIQKLEKYIDETNDETDEKKRVHLFEKLKQDEAIPPYAPVRHIELPAFEKKVSPLRSIFGTTSSAGKVIFFDAIPTNPENLVMDLDVMNPHYSDYYQGGNTPPADYLNPRPVFFLTIAPNSKFLFAVASEDRALAQQAQTWLQTALRKMGVGAKTTAGYGLWR